ncbi:GntR family transcriptional regulator [Desulfobacula sp.]|uniref:GntR family transcriptional regulator n=1 Tax=Desulfobacula sp. TaxID=2593537 RepID=UPI002636EA78|nr:GntR family transcriptional regulator [Desulfobacula sp.]
MPRKKININLPQPVSIREKVCTTVRNSVLSGQIAPGERIVEARIAREINTSRTPVREALHMLEREGLLEVIPRVGYRVLTLDKDEIEELCEIRIVNETLAAQWAIDRITPKELKALEENLNKARAGVSNGNPERFVDDDLKFHEILNRASGNKRLFEFCQLLRGYMLRYRMKTLYNAETAIRAIEGHQVILESIKSKNKQAAAVAVRNHLEWVKLDIMNKVFNHP